MGIRTSMWFIPSLMVLITCGLAFAGITYDDQHPLTMAAFYPQPFQGGADSIRMMLSAIATSMITVSGITFSLTISSLAQESGQLTARVLRNFMTNLTNKLVLGFFVSLFVYCLLVIRTIRIKDDADGPFIPHLSVFAAMCLAIVGVGVLIYFIHYVARSVQANTVVTWVAEEALEVIDDLYPTPLPDSQSEEPPRLTAAQEQAPKQVVLAQQMGYVQLIDLKKLRQLATDRQLLIRIDAGTGDYVTRQSPLVSLVGHSIPPDEELTRAINRTFHVQQTRAVDQELAFSIRQLVDIALKVLAPASNDMTTGVLVVDNMSSLLATLVQRQLIDPTESDDNLVTKPATFPNLMRAALDQIREASLTNPVMLCRLLHLLHVVGRATHNPQRRAVLLDHARLIAQQADAELPRAYNRQLVHEQLVDTLKTLGQPADAFGDCLLPNKQ